MPKTLQAKQLMIHYTDEFHQAMLIFVLTGNICRLRITFANVFDPDQDGQNVVPDLDPSRLTL